MKAEETGTPLHVLALEPYLGLSHATFLDGYRRFSRHRIELWSLPPRKWKWRMRGAAYHFADLAARAGPSAAPDVVFASDFLNVCEWRALAPGSYSEAPLVLYFHENQITYPLSEAAPRDHHYGWINLSSALAAERVLFNSSFHRREFVSEVARVLSRMPDHVPDGLVAALRERSDVFPVGIDYGPHRDAFSGRAAAAAAGPPVLVWNHRWEHDKGPDLLVAALLELRRAGVDFRLIICGQQGRGIPTALQTARERFADDIVHFGFYEERAEYLSALAGADVVLSTARHDFFGVAVAEAIFLGCLPVLPRALGYPELIPPRLHERFLYDSEGSLSGFLRRFLEDPPTELSPALRKHVEAFDWRWLAPRLDDILDAVARRGKRADVGAVSPSAARRQSR